MNQKLGLVIKEARKSLKISSKDLAKQIGVSNVSLSNYENSKKIPQVCVLAKIAEILHLNYETLYEMRTKEKEKRKE